MYFYLPAAEEQRRYSPATGRHEIVINTSIHLRNPDLPFLSKKSEVFNDQGSIGFGMRHPKDALPCSRSTTHPRLNDLRAGPNICAKLFRAMC